ncbi:hypothetical protein PInf_026477 [Phytophthora infestans]|nr:hypothetical protein PInf_026477 [Phytophthora infestans]
MPRIRSNAATREAAVAGAVRPLTSLTFVGCSGQQAGRLSALQGFQTSGVTFVIESGFFVDRSDDSGTEDDGESVVDGEIAADETVAASQINTSIMLSTNTIEDMFGSSGESDIEGTVSRVTDIADASRVSVGDGSNDTAKYIPSIDGEGGLGVEDRESAEDDDRVVAAASDVNVLGADELSEGYESVGSDESDESDTAAAKPLSREGSIQAVLMILRK